MSTFSGRQAKIGIAKQSDRDTTASSADYWIPQVGYNFTEKVVKIKDESGLGTLATPQGSDIVKEWTEGDITMHIRDLSIGLLLLSLFGTETFDDDAPQAGVGTHVFTLAESNSHQSLTIFKSDSNQNLASSNAMITSMQIQAVLDQYAQITFGLMGEKFESQADTVGYVAENKFRPQDLTIKLAASVAALAASSAVGKIKSINFTANKNVEDTQALGSVTPDDFHNKDFVVEGSMEVIFDAATFKDYVLNNTNRAMSLEFKNLGVTIGTSTNPSLKFEFDEVTFDEFTQDYDNSNLVTLSITFTALYNMTNASMLKATLINTRNSVY